jgi:DNA-binding PadR family transcriptional regulator
LDDTTTTAATGAVTPTSITAVTRSASMAAITMRGPRGRGGRMGRFFDHGDLRFVVLKLIAEKPSHGYELIKAIETAAGGAYTPSPGVVYPTLTLLEELGYVTAGDAGGGKKLYTITAEGESLPGQQRCAGPLAVRAHGRSGLGQRGFLAADPAGPREPEDGPAPETSWRPADGRADRGHRQGHGRRRGGIEAI